jgi:hypothetical protein
MKTYSWRWRIAARILNLVTRWRWVVSFTPWPRYPWGKSSRYPLVRRVGEYQSRHGRGGEENNTSPCRDSKPGRPVRKPGHYTGWTTAAQGKRGMEGKNRQSVDCAEDVLWKDQVYICINVLCITWSFGQVKTCIAADGTFLCFPAGLLGPLTLINTFQVTNEGTCLPISWHFNNKLKERLYLKFQHGRCQLSFHRAWSCFNFRV